MRKITITVAFCFAAYAAAGDQVWRFDRLDRIGNHKTNVLGHPVVIQAGGRKAIQFNGVDDAVFVPVHPLAGAGAFTWEVIFRPDIGGAPEQRFFHLQEDGSDDRMLFELRVIGNEWCLDSFAKSGDASKALLDRTKLHPLGEWYAAEAVYDGREFRNYVDGVLQGAAELRFTPQKAGQTSIGVRFTKVNYFKGAVAEARFTRHALAPAEFLKK